MPDSGAHEYFALLEELREFRAGPLGGEPSDRALGRAAEVKADTVKAWLEKGQFPQDVGKLAAVVRAVAAEAEARGIVLVGRQAVGLDVEQWRRAHREEATRRNGDVSAGALRGQAARALAAGRLLTEVTDPFGLEVHRPLRLDGLQQGLLELPAYVRRQHDQALAEVVRAVADGRGGIAVLVGGSSTGKTRACWEALELLRGRPERWRLWHPIDPSRPEAALRELSSIGPRTVVWLNEAQFYLAPGGLGERVAAGLRELLRDPARGPVLVLATLWPQYWDELTARPPVGAEDPHAQARELLAGQDITVPAAFTAAEVERLGAAGDPRLDAAAAAAEDGRVVQFLAGAPELIARYRNAPPPAAALINAAIDARRLGMGPGLSLAFLEAAADGYLGDDDWDALPEGWLEQALGYTAAPAKGSTRGPLTRIRPRDATALTVGPAYRLADYLDQHGRRTRRRHMPPAAFWTAAARYADLASLTALASAAQDRGLLRDAARLLKCATVLGDADAPLALLRLCHSRRGYSADPRPAQWIATHASLDDPAAVARLLWALRRALAREQATALAARDPAADASLDDPAAVASLLWALRAMGAQERVAWLAARAAAHASLDDPAAVASLLWALQRMGAQGQAAALAARAAAHASLDDPAAVASLLNALRAMGAQERVAWLAARAAAHASLDDPAAVARLLKALQEAGAQEQAATLLGRDPAAHANLDDPTAVANLLWALRGMGAQGQAAALAARAAAHDSLDDRRDTASLLEALQEAGAQEQAAALLVRDPAAHDSLDDQYDAASLLWALQKAGAQEQAAALAARAAAHDSLDDRHYAASLLWALREAGAQEQVRILIGRLPAEGQFALFLEQAGHQALYQSGREPDGSPAPSWGWDDLD
jgi:hypothetical protein